MAQQLAMQQYDITGLRCNGCAAKLTAKLNNIKGLEPNVSFSLGKIIVKQPTKEQFTDLLSMVNDNGYALADEQASFSVSGWRCAGCANKTKDMLLEHPAILKVEVNVTSQQLHVRYIKGAISHGDIGTLVDTLGYELSLEAAGNQDALVAAEQHYQRQNKRQRHQLIIASVFTIPLVLPMVLMLFGLSLSLNPWLELGLASVVQFYVGQVYYHGAWISFKNRSANMDTLVALGTSAAYFYSCYLVFSDWQAAHGRLYFEASAVIITFVSIGKWLEHRAKHSTGQAIRDLLALKPITANVIKGDQLKTLPLAQVLLGNKVRVLAGEIIPVDGLITQGESEVDESLLTGESMPVHKRENDQVIAGSVNGNGVLSVEVTAVGENTSLSHIIKLVEKAQMTKAPIEKLVDKVASIFVPAILSIALLTFGVWLSLGTGFEQALINSVSVLVVACPCALGLATPAAIAVGSGVAAKNGIIIREPAALQIATKLDRVAFDKTGTLTIGQPTVIAINKYQYDVDVEAMLGSLMEHSEHPLAKAIVKEHSVIEAAQVTLEQVKIIPGKGITAFYQDQQLSAGNRDLMDDLAVGIDNQSASSNYSQVFFAIDKQLVAVIELSDKSREQSANAIARLQQKQLKTAMLSGDHAQAAKHIADELNIDQVFANLKPEQKLAQLKVWQQQEVVAMVGDGINDAPALAQADLGIAMGTGTQVAISSAQITLMRGDPQLVIAAIDIASATWTKIKQNLFLAFIFNSLAVPLAAMGYLSPQLAGLAMALSSVTVLGNALLLKNWRHHA